MRDDAHLSETEPPHPLALSLAAALLRGACVLVVGAGSGRSLPPLREAGLHIDIAAADDQDFSKFEGPYDAILSTHALLHGTRADVEARVRRLVSRLCKGGRFHATFGSTLDPRCGMGTWITDDTWAPTSGPEAGVPHSFFHRAALEALLRPFREGRMEEREVGDIVGTWAHSHDAPSRPSVHWFVEAKR